MKGYFDFKRIFVLCFCLFLTNSSTLSLNPDYFLVPRDSTFISWPTTTVEFGQQTRKERITLDEIIYGFFAPKTFNGSWISDDELLYRDTFGNLALMNLSAPLHEEPKILVSNITFQQYFVQRYLLSPDRNYLLMVFNVKKQFRHTYLAHHIIYRIHDETKMPVGTNPESRPDLQYASWGPKGSQLVFVEKDNIYYQKCAECPPEAVTNSKETNVILNGIPDWLYEEEILSKNNAIWFSPNGSRLCYASFDDSLVDVVSFPFYGSTEEVVKGGLYRIRYPKPGRINPSVILWVVDLESSPSQPIRLIPPPDITSSEYYFTTVSWIDEKQLMVTWMRREQNYSSISVCSANNTLSDGHQWPCLSIETINVSNGWVDLYDTPIFSSDSKFCFLRLPSLQSQEKGFFKHIFKISIDRPHDVKPVTRGLFDITEIVKFDPKNKYLYYISTLEGRPGERHLFRVDTEEYSLGQESAVCMTCDLSPDCLFNNAYFSTDASYYVLDCLGPGVPKVTVKSLRDFNEEERIIQENEQVQEELQLKSLPKIKTLSVPVNGGYNASVRLYLPPSLNENEVTKYPLVIQVYGGPGSQQINERFSVNWGYYLSSRKNIIYGMIDGRGSGYKGDKFLHELYHKLGSVEVEDQIEVTRYLKENFSFINKDKVAIWGWSYGGYVTAMALANDASKNAVFSCGISVAPVTDWLLYDSAYTERYMSSPQKNWRSYVKASVLNKAMNIKGKKFLLVHGTADDNVHISQSMLLMKALSRNGVIFKSQVYPDENHGLHGVLRHLYQTMEDFLSDCFSLDVVYDDVGLRRSRILSRSR